MKQQVLVIQAPTLFALAVDPAQITVPPNGNNVGEENAVLQRQKREVDSLNERPHHPVGLESRPPRLFKTLLGASALHGSHAAKERTDHDWGEEGLIAEDASSGLNSSVGKIDVACQESKPSGSNGAKHTASVQSHSTSTGKVMVLDSTLLNKLLRSDVSCSEENSSRDALSEQRAGSEAAIVPGRVRLR